MLFDSYDGEKQALLLLSAEKYGIKKLTIILKGVTIL